MFTGIPSTTIRAPLLPMMEVMPLITMRLEAPGVPEELVICTPATLPVMALRMLGSLARTSSSAFISCELKVRFLFSRFTPNAVTISALREADLPYILLDENVETISNRIAISTMHLAKGLEFRAVAVMACDDEVIPSQVRIERITDNADLEDIYNTERHLLYVACTRARDYLLETCAGHPSEFLEDLKINV